jgi:hypothetical protein
MNASSSSPVIVKLLNEIVNCFLSPMQEAHSWHFAWRCHHPWSVPAERWQDGAAARPCKPRRLGYFALDNLSFAVYTHPFKFANKNV